MNRVNSSIQTGGESSQIKYVMLGHLQHVLLNALNSILQKYKLSAFMIKTDLQCVLAVQAITVTDRNLIQKCRIQIFLRMSVK